MLAANATPMRHTAPSDQRAGRRGFQEAWVISRELRGNETGTTPSRGSAAPIHRQIPVLLQHRPRQIQRPGDQDPRRRRPFCAAASISQRRADARRRPRGEADARGDRGDLVAVRAACSPAIGTAITSRASPWKWARKPAVSLRSARCRRSAPAGAARPPRNRPSPRRARARPPRCARRRARPPRCAGARATSGPRAQPLQPRRPIAPRARPRSNAGGRQVRRDRAQRRDRVGGVAELMAAGQPRQRQVEQPEPVLEHQPAVLGADEEIAIGDDPRRADAASPRARSRAAPPAPAAAMIAGAPRLQDARLLVGDLVDRRAEKLGMIDRNRRDDGRGRVARSRWSRRSARRGRLRAAGNRRASRLNSRNAAAVVISNTEIDCPALTRSHSSSAASSRSSSTSSPARRMRSLKRTRCGEV